VSGSAPWPQRSTLGVECCRLASQGQRHPLFTLPAENHRSGPSRLRPRFYCFAAAADPRLFSPTLSSSLSKKHISTLGRPHARKQQTGKMTAHLTATTTSAQVQAGVSGCTRWGLNSPPDRPPQHLRIDEALGQGAAKRTQKNACSVRQQRANPSSHVPKQGAQP